MNKPKTLFLPPRTVSPAASVISRRQGRLRRSLHGFTGADGGTVPRDAKSLPALRTALMAVLLLTLLCTVSRGAVSAFTEPVVIGEIEGGEMRSTSDTFTTAIRGSTHPDYAPIRSVMEFRVQSLPEGQTVGNAALSLLEAGGSGANDYVTYNITIYRGNGILDVTDGTEGVFAAGPFQSHGPIPLPNPVASVDVSALVRQAYSEGWEYIGFAVIPETHPMPGYLSDVQLFATGEHPAFGGNAPRLFITPVPEPSAALLGFGAAAGMLLQRRRRTGTA